MRLFILIAALMMGPCLSAQQWTPWKVSASFTKDSEGYESFRSMKGKDSTGALWQITWDPAAVVVTAPDGSHKALDKAFPVEAHPHGGMSISNSDIERWRYKDWECLRLRINTGRNGIGMDYYLVVVVDQRSRDWAVCSGRVTDESIEGPKLSGDHLVLQWSDEEDKRPLRVKHEWRAVRTAEGIRVNTPPVIYQLEYGYPYWFRFWSDVTSPDPGVAEHQGWLSVAWQVTGADKSGGTANSVRTAIPKAPGKQVWRKGTGPDIWFPVVGTVKFRWEEEVEVRRFAHPSEKVAPGTAAELAAGSGWDVILTRDSKGNYIGAMLIDRESGNCGRFPAPGFDGPVMRAFRGDYTNPNYGFRVVIPPGLTGHDSPAPNPHHGFGIVLSWEPRSYAWVNGEYNASMEKSVHEVTLQILAWKREDARMVRSSEIVQTSVGGRPGERLILRYECGENQTKRVLYEVVFMRDQTLGTVYQVGLDTTEDREKDDLKVFDQILSSWAFVAVE